MGEIILRVISQSTENGNRRVGCSLWFQAASEQLVVGFSVAEILVEGEGDQRGIKEQEGREIDSCP